MEILTLVFFKLGHLTAFFFGMVLALSSMGWFMSYAYCFQYRNHVSSLVPVDALNADAANCEKRGWFMLQILDKGASGAILRRQNR